MKSKIKWYNRMMKKTAMLQNVVENWKTKGSCYKENNVTWKWWKHLWTQFREEAFVSVRLRFDLGRNCGEGQSCTCHETSLRKEGNLNKKLVMDMVYRKGVTSREEPYYTYRMCYKQTNWLPFVVTNFWKASVHSGAFSIRNCV